MEESKKKARKYGSVRGSYPVRKGGRETHRNVKKKSYVDNEVFMQYYVDNNFHTIDCQTIKYM